MCCIDNVSLGHLFFFFIHNKQFHAPPGRAPKTMVLQSGFSMPGADLISIILSSIAAVHLASASAASGPRRSSRSAAFQTFFSATSRFSSLRSNIACGNFPRVIVKPRLWQLAQESVVE